MRSAPIARGWVTPCIVSPRGVLANHHFTPSGLIGERVTAATATHFTVVCVSDQGNLMTDVVLA